MRLWYYLRNAAHHAKPAALHARRYARLMRYRDRVDPVELERRLGIYLGTDQPFELPDGAEAAGDFRKTAGTVYYLDTLEFLRYVRPDARFAYRFGDDLTPCARPTISKVRSLVDPTDHAVLFKLNKWRHFRFVDDPTPWRAKDDRAVWRGIVAQPWRRAFVQATHDLDLCDIGQTHPAEDAPWVKPRLTVAEQLRAKFLFSIEGNELATNLKWILSSNSLCVMPEPKVESWFLERELEPGVHYARIADDYGDVPEVLEHYLAHPDEAEAIIANAHAHVARFRDPDLEDLLGLLVLLRYGELSGQGDVARFPRPVGRA